MGARALQFKMTGDTKLFKDFFTPPKMQRAVEREIRKGTITAALFLVKRLKDEIRLGNFPENQPMTLALSKGTKPLRKELNLMTAIEYVINNAFSAEVGFFGRKNTTGGLNPAQAIQVQKLVELTESGYTITVTPRMIVAIMAALRSQKTKKGNIKKSAKAGLRALSKTEGGKGKRVFRVPPRPFVTNVFTDPSVETHIQQIWREALERAFLLQGAKGGDHKDR